MKTLKRGETAFLLENNREVQQVTILNCSGGIYTIRLPAGGMSKVKGHRLFPTPEEAENSIQKRTRPSFRMSGTMYT